MEKSLPPLAIARGAAAHRQPPASLRSLALAALLRRCTPSLPPEAAETLCVKIDGKCVKIDGNV